MKQLNRDEIKALNPDSLYAKDTYNFSGKEYKLLNDQTTDNFYIYVYIIRSTFKDGEPRSHQKKCFKLEAAEVGDWKRLVAEEIDEKTDAQYREVYRPIGDWKERISNLYNVVKEWLKDHRQYSVKTTSTSRMYEERMQTFDAEPENIPIADILKDGKLVLSIKPFGLWIIGTNGCLNILSYKGPLILADMSEPFQPPRWEIFFLKNRKKGMPFTKDYLLKRIR